MAKQSLLSSSRLQSRRDRMPVCNTALGTRVLVAQRLPSLSEGLASRRQAAFNTTTGELGADEMGLRAGLWASSLVF